MNILLIRGAVNKKAIDLSHYTFSEPLGLQMLYSILSEQHNVEIFDMLADKKSLEFKLDEKSYDICGISSACNDIFMIKKLARKIKKIRNIPIFIGGYQVRKTPELFKSKYIDFIMVETNRENLYEMLYSITNSKSHEITGVLTRKSDFKECQLRGIEETFEINRESVEKYKNKYSYFLYKPVVLMEFYREQSLCEKIKNIEQQYIVFIDMDFFMNEEKVIDFFMNVKKSNIRKKFLVYGNKESLVKMRKHYLFFKENGLGSVILFFNENDTENVSLVHDLEDSKINVWAYFNLSPQMNKLDFRELRSYIKKLKVGVVTLYPQYPFYSEESMKYYKDSLIFKREIRANRYPGYVLIKPFNMSLKSYYIEILKTSLYSYRLSFFSFYTLYGFRNSLIFFWKSLELLYKYLKIIVKIK